MAQDLEELLDEYGIEYIIDGQNSSKDYININCQDVGCCINDMKHKRGIHRSGKFTNCWAGSGNVSIFELVKSLGIPWNEWAEAIEELEDEWDQIDKIKEYKDEEPEETDEGIIIPGETLHPVHINYLESRGFDVDFLVKEFGLKGIVGNGNYYKGTEFAKEDFKLQYRVIIPIYYNGVPISYLGRSYLDSVDNRYMCCIKPLEAFFHKLSLFRVDEATGDTVLLVEGTMDVMKLVQASGNKNIICSYGTQTTPEQLQMLRKRYKHVIILFDAEKLAQEHAEHIQNYLESYGIKCTNLKLKLGEDVDPGKLPLPIAKALVEHYLGKEK